MQNDNNKNNVVDHQGNTTIMEFTNIRANSFVSPNIFDFVVPANVQIVRPPTGTP